MEKDQVSIFLVDDDSTFLKMMAIEFRLHTDYLIETFATGEACLKELSKKPALIVLDFHLDGMSKDAMNGISTLEKIKETDKDIPVVMLSSQDKIEVAVDSIHKGAIDYIVKSETAFFRLQQLLPKILEFKKLKKELNWYMDRM